MIISPKFFSIVILAAGDSTQDEWMVSDAVKIWLATHNPISGSAPDESFFFSYLDPRSFIGSRQDGVVIGPHTAKHRLLLPYPESPEVISNASLLKAKVMARAGSIANKMKAGDTLFVAFSAHGEQGGDIVFGAFSDGVTLSQKEFELCFRNTKGRIVLWLGSCYGGSWTKSNRWFAFAAGDGKQEVYSLVKSTSGRFRGSEALWGGFQALGEAARFDYPHPTDTSASSSFQTPKSPIADNMADSMAHLSLVELASQTANMMRRTAQGNTLIERKLQVPTSMNTQVALPFIQFSDNFLSKITILPTGTAHPPTNPGPTSGMPLRTSGKTASAKSPLSTQLELLTAAFQDADYLTSRSVIHVNNHLASPNHDILELTHVISYQQTLLFLASAPKLTGRWNLQSDMQPKVRHPLRDALAKQRSENLDDTMSHLLELLNTVDIYTPHRLDWNSSVVEFFLGVWAECGAPKFEWEELKEARKEVLSWISSVAQAHPDLACSGCTGPHLVFTEQQYQELFDYRTQESLNFTECSHGTLTDSDSLVRLAEKLDHPLCIQSRGLLSGFSMVKSFSANF